MENDVLVGSTGFVGGNLAAKHAFNLALHSTDVDRAFGQKNGLLVYAGVPAAMFLANQDPQADLAVMAQARENIRRIHAKKTVLISTIAVYADSRGRTEANDPEGPGLAAYGKNRLQLERWVRQDFADALILRLPALYGPGLKKNFLYDLHTLTPALLREEKYRELAAQSPLVAQSYQPGQGGFWQVAPGADRAALRQWFAGASFNALAFTDSRSRYQFYDLRCLWGHIQRALEAGLTLVNLTTPPVSAAEVAQYVTGRAFCGQRPGQPFDYDLHSLHAQTLGGEESYLCTRAQELESIKKFMEEWT